MIYRLYPKKDATIYEDTLRKNQNTGKDEILEVIKLYDTDNTTLLGNSRALLQYDLSTISQSIVDGDISGSIKYYLHLESIDESQIASNYTLYVYPLKESWDEGVGSEPDTPHNVDGVSWVYRNGTDVWDVINANANTGKHPSNVPGLSLYYDFVSTLGEFTLIDAINGINGTATELNISSSFKMEMSASAYGGGTANLSASLSSGSIYYIDFEVDPTNINGIDFRIQRPDNTYYTAAEVSNYTQNLTTAATHSVSFTASNSGNHNIQFTFFDENNSNGVTATIDNFFIYKMVSPGTLVNDTFVVNGTPASASYFLTEPITGSLGETPSIFVSQSKLTMSASNFGGATLFKRFELFGGIGYTASFNANSGNMFASNSDVSSSIAFTILEPDGRQLQASEMDGYSEYLSGSIQFTSSFVAAQDGHYYFRWTYYNDTIGDASASLSSFVLKTDPTLYPTGAYYSDRTFEARYNVNSGGGTWYTSSWGTNTTYSQSFDKYVQNVNVEVTEYVNDWLRGDRVNNGLIVLKSRVDEASTKKFGSMKYFSSDTHTIYPPTLDIRWDNFTFTTGSLSALSSASGADDVILYVKGLLTEYKETSQAKIRVFGRERYATRTFSSSPTKVVKYLPTTAYYSVVDAETHQTIIPFDDTYTKISCDSTSNYFNFWFNGLQPERFYKFVFKVVMNGTTKYYDDNFYFKVVK
jgi:hypothetical protein